MAEPRRSLRVAVASTFLALATSTGHARADIVVSIHYESEEELEHARRVASELASEGYTVEVGNFHELTPCEPNGPAPGSVPPGTKAWIRLGPDPLDPGQVVAFVCYLGMQPLLQQAAPSAPRAESEKLALAAAEALNGLRARLPPLPSRPEPPTARVEPTRSEPPPPDHAAARRAAVANSIAFGASVVRNLPDFETTLGATGRGTLGVTPWLGFVLEAFVPATSGEVESEQVSAKLRTAWIRGGPRLGGVLGDFGLSGVVLAGPALTWATAEATPPRTGTADVAAGAIVTVGVTLEYPTHAGIFGFASASGSALIPGARVKLGEGVAEARGYFPIDSAVGLGVRWGE
jgi:hypothetical protein